MTDTEFRERMFNLRNVWANDSNEGNPSPTKLLEFCEQFIEEMDEALDETESHPEPPPPRVR